MKIQSLAIIFIILILPISLILESYTKTRVETISLQSQYDSKLMSATYDAIKAYQLNNFNSEMSGITNSKLRDINASANSFFNSIASGFSSLGYTKETIQNYVPALVYTMYDGYYIYSSFINTWDEETQSQHNSDPSYHNGETLSGLKPYVYYSCRYVRGNTDVVITYSLDNYIQIQGLVAGEPVSKYGYILNRIDGSGNSFDYYYSGNNKVTITPENSIIQEKIYIEGNEGTFPCIKKNGTKYYYDSSKPNDEKVFTVNKGRRYTRQIDVTIDDFIATGNTRSSRIL